MTSPLSQKMNYFDLRESILTSQHPRQYKRHISTHKILFPRNTKQKIKEKAGYFVLLEASKEIELIFVDTDENIIYLMEYYKYMTLEQLLNIIEWLRDCKSNHLKKLLKKIFNFLEQTIFNSEYYTTGLTRSILSTGLKRNDVDILMLGLKTVTMTEKLTKSLVSLMLYREHRNTVSKILLKYCSSHLIAKYLHEYTIEEFPIATLILMNEKQRRPYYEYYSNLCAILDYKDGYRTIELKEMIQIYKFSPACQQMLFRSLSLVDFDIFLSHVHQNPHFFICHFNQTTTNDFLALLTNYKDSTKFLDLIYCSSNVEFKAFCCKCLLINTVYSNNFVKIIITNCLFSNFTSLRTVAITLLKDAPLIYFEYELLIELCMRYLNTDYPTLRESCISILLLLNTKKPIENLPQVFKKHSIPHFQSSDAILDIGFKLLFILEQTPQTVLDGLEDETKVLDDSTCIDVSKIWRQTRDIGEYLVEYYELFNQSDILRFYVKLFSKIRHWGLLNELLPCLKAICSKLNNKVLIEQYCRHYQQLLTLQINRIDGKYSGLAYLALSPLYYMNKQDKSFYLQQLIQDTIKSDSTTLISCIIVILNDPILGYSIIEFTPHILQIIFTTQQLQWGGKCLNSWLKRVQKPAFECFKVWPIESIVIKALKNEDSRILALAFFSTDLPTLNRFDFEYEYLITTLIECGYCRHSKNRAMASRILCKLVKNLNLKKNSNANYNAFVDLVAVPMSPTSPESIIESDVCCGHFKVEKASWNLLKLNGPEEDIIMHYYKQGIIIPLSNYQANYTSVLKGDYAFEFAIFVNNSINQ